MSNYKVKTIKGFDAISNYSEMSELKIHLADSEHRAFLQRGFFEHDVGSTILHNHRYCEIHIVRKGNVEILLEGKHITLCQNEGIVIPVGMYHARKCENADETSICAFQTDLDVNKAEKVYLGNVTELLFSEIDRYNKSGECRQLQSLLSLVCSYFFSGKASEPIPMIDREFIIYEFFANNYDKDVSLSDIALQLRLSEKQAERLIIKSTGMSFRRQIVTKRIENAKMLVKTEGITLAKAAERVGYQSYSGFWKALQAYEEYEKNGDTAE